MQRACHCKLCPFYGLLGVPRGRAAKGEPAFFSGSGAHGFRGVTVKGARIRPFNRQWAYLLRSLMNASMEMAGSVMVLTVPMAPISDAMRNMAASSLARMMVRKS